MTACARRTKPFRCVPGSTPRSPSSGRHGDPPPPSWRSWRRRVRCCWVRAQPADPPAGGTRARSSPPPGRSAGRCPRPPAPLPPRIPRSRSGSCRPGTTSPAPSTAPPARWPAAGRRWRSRWRRAPCSRGCSARRLGLPRWAAAPGLAVVAFSPLATDLHRTVQPGALAAPWLLAALALARTRRPSTAAWATGGVALAAAVLTSPVAAAAAPAVAWQVWRTPRPSARPRALLAFLAGAAGAGALGGSWSSVVARRSPPAPGSAGWAAGWRARSATWWGSMRSPPRCCWSRPCWRRWRCGASARWPLRSGRWSRWPCASTAPPAAALAVALPLGAVLLGGALEALWEWTQDVRRARRRTSYNAVTGRDDRRRPGPGDADRAGRGRRRVGPAMGERPCRGAGRRPRRRGAGGRGVAGRQHPRHHAPRGRRDDVAGRRAGRDRPRRCRGARPADRLDASTTTTPSSPRARPTAGTARAAKATDPAP